MVVSGGMARDEGRAEDLGDDESGVASVRDRLRLERRAGLNGTAD
jgi:hypothetical protein